VRASGASRSNKYRGPLQTFHPPSLSPIEGFHRCAPFKAFGVQKFNVPVQGFKVRFGGGIARFDNSQNVKMRNFTFVRRQRFFFHLVPWPVPKVPAVQWFSSTLPRTAQDRHSVRYRLTRSNIQGSRADSAGASMFLEVGNVERNMGEAARLKNQKHGTESATTLRKNGLVSSNGGRF
jgi:hypothetical protein